jgi:hypothetical protein
MVLCVLTSQLLVVTDPRFHPLVADPKGSTPLLPAEHFPRGFWNNALYTYCPLHPSYMLNPVKTDFSLIALLGGVY